jgi:hypothetical protein
VEVLDPASTRGAQPGGPGTLIYIPQEQGGPVIPLCTDRVENKISNSTSIVECVSVAAGTFLPSHCLETALTPYNINF